MNAFYYFLSVVVTLTLFSSSCKKQVVKPVDQLSLLPPATQTGARTFGCLINGQTFVPENENLLEGPRLQCNYIYTKGGYYFAIGNNNTNKDGSVTGVIIETDSLSISEGKILSLNMFATAGMAYGSYVINAIPVIPFYHTNLEQTGQLNITHFDTVKQIVSGTFYFTAINSLNDTVKVTGGRFDMPYTR